jgi:hypothetical protein
MSVIVAGNDGEVFEEQVQHDLRPAVAEPRKRAVEVEDDMGDLRPWSERTKQLGLGLGGGRVGHRGLG